MESHGEKDSSARIAADRAMLRGTLNDAWKASWWKSPIYCFLAWRYYRAVRALGTMAFTFRESEDEVAAVTGSTLMKEAGNGRS